MNTMTVLELLQCFAWGFFGILPLGISVLSVFSNYENKNDSTDGFFIFFLAVCFQVAFGIAAFKAGGK